MLKILEAPQSVLSTPSIAVKLPADNSVLKLIKDMEKTLTHAKDPKGVGLAAPQVGAGIRLFITKPTDKSKTAIFINPEILSMKEINLRKKSKKTNSAKKKDKRLEGCLSLPSIWGEVKRSESLTLSYFDENGQKHTKEFKRFMATIVQHEMDHLNGILFPRHVLEQKGKLYKSEKDEDGDDVFEEIKL